MEDSNKKKVSNRDKVLPIEDTDVNKPMIDAAQHIVITGSIEEAAKIADRTPATIRKWISEDGDFKRILETFTEAMLTEMKAELVGVSREALQVERQIMLDPDTDPKEKLKAAQDIMERAGLNPKKQQQVDITNTHNFFAELPDEELDKIIDIDFEETNSKDVANGNDDREQREDGGSET